jgi:hypothetical protein
LIGTKIVLTSGCKSFNHGRNVLEVCSDQESISQMIDASLLSPSIYTYLSL